MKSRKNLRLAVLLILVAFNIGCDQVSKSIVRTKINFDQQIDVIKNHFILTKVENTGAFLSAGNELPSIIRLILLSLLPIVVLGYGLYFLISRKDLPIAMQVGISFLIGGGIGNVYDRIVYGSVTDFMHIDFGLFRTGIFNLADVSIMVGIAILFIHSIKNKMIHAEK